VACTWLDDLNPAQRQAVTFGDGPLLIVAGAGTGKTKTLACRVAYLIEQGVNSGRILLLTFTRRAAAEMINRARHMCAHSGAANVWGGTFHAVANRLLRMYAPALRLSPDFTVMDQSDAADLMNLMVVDRHFPWCAGDLDDIKPIFDQYVQRKTDQNLFDYDDLLLYWKALCDAPSTGSIVADRFDHVLVDEYQDTNAVQAEILRGMRKKHENICVVGDDAQSIYSFRAATIRNILDFPTHFPGTEIVTLEENYRSTKPILAASNAVMEQASERYTKELWSQRQSDVKPRLINCVDEAHQTNIVCRNILAHLEQDVPLMHQAVLFRAGFHSADLEIELTRRNIPFHKYGGLKFIEAAHVKDMLACLRICENPYDQISWFRVLQLLPGIGSRIARRIMDALTVRNAPAPTGRNGDGTSPIVSPLARLFAESPSVPTPAREPFAEFREALAHCCGTKLNASPDQGDADAGETSPSKEPPLPAQIERIGLFLKPIFERVYENAAVRLRDVEQLEHIAGRYRSRNRFITDLTLDPPTATSDLAQPPHLDEDFLVLSTIHSAKGCEWTVVHIIHAADGMIPSDMAVGDLGGVEEERRLFYVAMTRAKESLYVYFPLRYYHTRFRTGDRHTYAQLTRFVSPQVRRLFEEQTPLDDLPDKDVSPNAQSVPARIRRLWDD
jgi:DNA helicase-2/ATP-dependent DNA helicase PcrA